MPDALVLVDAIADRADTLLPSWTDDRPEAAWVHVSGELDRVTVPQLERIGDVAPRVQPRLEPELV
jgi:hypothetical protein